MTTPGRGVGHLAGLISPRRAFESHPGYHCRSSLIGNGPCLRSRRIRVRIPGAAPDPLSPTAEAPGSKSGQSEFESRRGYHGRAAETGEPQRTVTPYPSGHDGSNPSPPTNHSIKSSPVSPRSAAWAGVGCESPRGYGSSLTLKVVGSIPASGAPNIEAWGASGKDRRGGRRADGGQDYAVAGAAGTDRIGGDAGPL